MKTNGMTCSGAGLSKVLFCLVVLLIGCTAPTALFGNTLLEGYRLCCKFDTKECKVKPSCVTLEKSFGIDLGQLENIIQLENITSYPEDIEFLMDVKVELTKAPIYSQTNSDGLKVYSLIPQKITTHNEVEFLWRKKIVNPDDAYLKNLIEEGCQLEQRNNFVGCQHYKIDDNYPQYYYLYRFLPQCDGDNCTISYSPPTNQKKSKNAKFTLSLQNAHLLVKNFEFSSQHQIEINDYVFWNELV